MKITKTILHHPSKNSFLNKANLMGSRKHNSQLANQNRSFFFFFETVTKS